MGALGSSGISTVPPGAYSTSLSSALHSGASPSSQPQSSMKVPRASSFPGSLCATTAFDKQRFGGVLASSSRIRSAAVSLRWADPHRRALAARPASSKERDQVRFPFPTLVSLLSSVNELNRAVDRLLQAARRRRCCRRHSIPHRHPHNLTPDSRYTPLGSSSSNCCARALLSLSC
jgi:hypothetical protein